MATGAARRKAFFDSRGTRCAAWHYPGTNGACLVMAPGFGVTKEAGTDKLASRFAEAGFTVVAFDYRRLGESGGEPRQVVLMRDQLADWDAALAFARTLPEVDPRRIAVWGFSASGGHVLNVAARHPELAGAIAHAPALDAPHATRHALRHFTPASFLKLNVLSLLDALGARLGRAPILIPLYGRRGELASISTPDSQNGPRALNPGGRYDDSWLPKIAARSAVRLGFYRPVRAAGRVQPPLLVLEPRDDGVVARGPAERAAKAAPRGEYRTLSGGHYGALLDHTDEAVDAIVDFLRRHVGPAAASAQATAAAPAAAAS